MDRVRKIFCDVLGIKPNELYLESSPLTIPEWDSLKLMQLIASFEVEFEYQLNIKQIMGLKTFGDFVAIADEISDGIH